MDQARASAPRNHSGLTLAFRALTTFDAASFFLGSAAHVGRAIPLGVATLHEPRIVPATIVEGLCGAALTVGAYAQFARKPWAWPATVAANAIALGGVFLGIGALSAGRGPRTELNDDYHRLMVVLLGGALVVLVTRAGRAALGRGETG
jgi:hypothetical protein